MKLIVVFACALLFAQGDKTDDLEEWKEEIKQTVEQCRAEIGATEDDVASLKGQNPTPTEKGKCFAACMMTKRGYLDESGKFNKDKIRTEMAKLKPLDEGRFEEHLKIVETCFDTVEEGKDKCDTAARLSHCIFKGHHGIE